MGNRVKFFYGRLNATTEDNINAWIQKERVTIAHLTFDSVNEVTIIIYLQN